MIRTARFIFALILCHTTLCALAVADNAHLINSLSSTPSKKVMEMARDCYYKRQIDSATVLFTLVANRYDNSANDDERKYAVEATKSMGDIYLIHYNETAKSYAYLSKAHNLAHKHGYKEVDASASMSMAVLYTKILETDGEVEMCDSVLSMLKYAFHTSVECKAWRIAIYSIYNLVVSSFPHNRVNDVRTEIEEFNTLEIPANIVDTKYMRAFANAFVAMTDRNFDKCEQYLGEMRHSLHNELKDDPNINYRMNYLSSMAEMRFQQKRIPEAMVYLDSVKTIVIPLGNKQLMMQIEHDLALYYKELGDMQQSAAHRLKELELKEEILTDDNFDKIRELSFLNRLDSANVKVQQLSSHTAKQRNIITIMGVVALAFALLIVALVRSYRSLRRSHEKLYDLNIKTQQRESEERKRSELLLEALKKHEQENPDADKAKYQSNVIDDQRKEEIFLKARRAMQDPLVICQPNFTLQDLAELIGEKKRDVSQVINEIYGGNFNSFINEYRIKEACRMMNNAEKQNLTIEAIAECVGIKSRSYFAAIFKRVTGLNPSEYIALAHENRTE